MPLIRARDLVKEFSTPKRRPGFLGAMRTLFTSEEVVTRAVDGVSFSVDEGELIGYLGPNGAGKSTTIKMLTGILVPTSGDVEVAGLVPWKARELYEPKVLYLDEPTIGLDVLAKERIRTFIAEINQRTPQSS